MSLSRPLKDPNGRQYSSDSFDRFGDDLSELLLSFLSLEDKFRFECVSKQWQRLVFNKVIHLKNYFFGTYEVNNMFNPNFQTNDQLKTVLQKCSNVKTLTLDVSEETVSSLLLFADNCPRLKSIKLFFIDDSPDFQQLETFGQKFGSKVEDLSCADVGVEESLINELLNWFPNLKRWESDGEDWPQLVGNQLVLSLNRLINATVKWDQMSEFVRFVDKYEKTLKDILIQFKRPGDLDIVFQQIYRFKNLECLYLDISDSNSDLTPRMTALSQNCPKLSEITFNISRFRLSRPTKPLIGIKSLKITCGENSDNTELRDDFFAILSNLTPNLRNFEFNSNLNYTNKHLIDLSRMRGIKRLVIKSMKDLIHSTDDSAVIQLLDKCNELKELKLEFLSNITEKTISKLKELAINKPKERITLETMSTTLRTEDLSGIPPNLLINLKPIHSNDYYSDESSSDDDNN